MKILLTGLPHSGKSTLLAKLVNGRSRPVQGFVTVETRKDDGRNGFLMISSDNHKAILASTELQTAYQVSRYFVDVEALDEFIEPLSVINPNALLYIDEIGQMQLLSDRFRQLTEVYLAAENDFIGTVSDVYSDNLIKDIKARQDIRIIEVTAENREDLFDRLQL